MDDTRNGPDADEVIVREVLGGKKDRFRVIIDRYQDRVYNLVRRFVGHDDAVDVAQDAFLRAYLHLDHYDPGYPFSNWLFKIAQNRAFTHLKRRAGHTGHPSLEFAADPDRCEVADVRPLNDPAAVAETKNTGEVLERALARVPAKYRLLIHLRHSMGLQGPEIAQIVGIPVGTVKYRFHEAYKVLRQVLVELGVVAP